MSENNHHVLQPEPSPDNGLISIELTHTAVVNFAVQQNKIPVLKKLVIHNGSSRDLRDLCITISSSPDLCKPAAQRIECIPAGSSFEVLDMALILNAEYLAGVTSKLVGCLSACLRDADGVLCTENSEITVLAFDEWPLRHPELLPAFVTPKHPVISPILARASELLGEWTQDPSLNGYLYDDPDRVLKQGAAIYTALLELELVYAVNPASQEHGYQSVRTADIIMEQKLCTCLDSTLLFASCCEAIGLHPILLEKSTHIFPGFWLKDSSFPEIVSDDPSIVSKRIPDGVNEIAVVESTLLTKGRACEFSVARRSAEKQFTTENPVLRVIDVERARRSGIASLPIRVMTPDGWAVAPENAAVHEKAVHETPTDAASIIELDESAESPLGKQQFWERHLLDLSLRNPLLNMRLTRSVIPLLDTGLDTLEDRLSEGAEYEIHARPNEMGSAGSLSLESMHDTGNHKSLVLSEFGSGRLRSALGEAELAHALKELNRGAKSSLEESSANTLFLALGQLRWYEKKTKKARYAPVLLLPIELIKKPGNRGYSLRMREDEPQINITILEKLRQDFEIDIKDLEELPTDDSGLDLRRIFSIIRRAVMHMPGWEIIESACIGLFSYAQFVMWNDIRVREAQLDENKIVRSLKEGRLVWEPESPALSGPVSEEGLLLPMPADASQLSAIHAAVKGLSFLLEGPPGAGKSTTITNIIVNTICSGKKVLFVSAKKDALDVVHASLEACGAGPFCLELHSNKSSKKSVLNQLSRTLEAAADTDSGDYEYSADRITALRRDLDGYSASLHRLQPCGMSTYELVNLCEQYRSAATIAAPDAGFAQKLDADGLRSANEAVEALVSAAKAIGHPAGNPLSAVHCPRYSQQLRMALTPAVAAYREALHRLAAARDALADVLGLEAPITLNDIDELVLTARHLKLWTGFPKQWAEAEDFGRHIRGVQELCRSCIRANKLRCELEESWNSSFFELDGKVLSEQYERALTRGVFAKAFSLSSLAGRVSSCAKTQISASELGSHLSRLAEYQAELEEVERLDISYGAGISHNGKPGFWNDILSDAKTAAESAVNLSRLCGGSRVRRECAGVRENECFYDELIESSAEAAAALAAMTELISLDPTEGDDWISSQTELCGILTEHAGELKGWAAWDNAAVRARNLGLGCVVDAYLDGMDHSEISGAAAKAIYTALTVHAIDSDDELGCFSGSMFNDKLEQFKRLDRELTELTREEIHHRLASRVPDLTEEAARSPELNILNRAIRSGGRGMSIRHLFDQLPELLPRLAPCMLMSPLSAAQYLSADFPLFDLVIFDEASQLPTAQAVGAISRGREAVIVGDPKQLPPTTFFTPDNSRDEDFEYEDLESILDDCLALSMPMAQLLWHYRSRHESLIAFSNRRFYGNRLRTFASVNDLERRVSLRQVDGCFERGGSRVNRAEARAIVEEIRRRSTDPELRAMSLGVVTFNISQQNLIEDLLAEACAADATLDAWVGNSAEPLFVKTLERVQGSERDVILFSIGYSPDKDGKLSLNFGPLNREGGWRRLNVAVTRARQEMLVFTSIKPEQIDLSRVSSEGVAALRAFLEYAAGRSIPEDKNSVRRSRRQSEGLADAICAALNERGWRTQRSVGRSEHRIDIAVIDPTDPRRYILGILLDGESYGSARSTRDRELAQIGVLQGLGWRIHRVWAMDWWDNSHRELERILDLLSERRAA